MCAASPPALTGDAGVSPAVEMSGCAPTRRGYISFPFSNIIHHAFFKSPSPRFPQVIPHPILFIDEGNFSSPASPERRGGGTGAGRYVRHSAANAHPAYILLVPLHSQFSKNHFSKSYMFRLRMACVMPIFFSCSVVRPGDRTSFALMPIFFACSVVQP